MVPEEIAVARQRLCKYVSVATDARTTVEELKRVPCIHSVPRLKS